MAILYRTIYYPFIKKRTIYMEWLLIVVVVGFLIFTFFKGGC